MNDSERARKLAALLRESGHAHHQAFAETDGADPEWPLWYAGHMQSQVAPLLGRDVTRSELVYLLVSAARAHERDAPDADWPVFYAGYLLQGYEELRGA
jgi:NAD(P)H-hydrate epimerase